MATYKLSTSNSWTAGTMTVTHTTDGTVTVKVKVYRSDGGTSYNYDASKNFYITIDGTKYEHTVTKVSGTSGKTFSSSKKVTLSASGTADVSITVGGSVTGTTFKLKATTKTYSITDGDRKKYTISLNGNNGQGVIKTQTKEHGVDLKISTVIPSRYGYEFLGWGTSSTTTTVSYKSGATFTTNDNITLYAIWKKTITLSYDINGGNGTFSNQTSTIYNSTTSSTFTINSNTPTRVGYNFLGWILNNTTTTRYSPGSTLKLTDSGTLKAVWEIKTYTISFNANGGSNQPNDYTKTYGINLIIPTEVPVRPGYKFLGWSVDINDELPMYTVGSTFAINENTILYAVWEQLGIVYVNINGEYKAGKVWVNDYGTWSTGIIFVNNNGTWTQGGI